MNINPETDLDLEKLFLPAWAQDTSTANRYAKFTGNEGAPRERRDDRSGPRPPRRDGGGGGGFGGPRREGQGQGQSRGPGGPGAPGGQRREGGFGGPRRDDRGGPRRDDRRDFRGGERRETPPPLPEIAVSVLPDEKGVESLARQIKMTGRAFPLFDIAHLIIQKPERYSLRFSVMKNAEGKAVLPLFLCALDDTLWLSEDEAVAHVLGKHFATFYQAEKTATEPPKGVYTFVGQCGMSGVILGPPNYHDYQNQLRKLHTERFARMPFDMFKARVKIVRDEAVVKQWVEEQSWKIEYTCLNVPEPLKLQSRADVEQHFRATHKDTIIKSVESHVVTGVAARGLRGGLSRLVQDILAQQRRFPMQIATSLSQAFAKHGLQFFKVNKTVTHVAVARPHFLDLETTLVSDTVKKIVDFINATAKCNRRKLIDALAPSPAPAPIPVVPVADVPAAGTEGAPVTPAAPPAAPEPTAEQTAIIADLHWLVHQGHVIEFANGTIETAKRPLPKPVKQEKKPATAPAEAAPTAEASPAPANAVETPAVIETEVSATETATETPAAEAASEPSVPEPMTEVPAAEPAAESPEQLKA